MSILYLLTSPEPVVEGTDAVFQEVRTLQVAFKGVSVNLFPFRKPSSRVPKSLYGLHRINAVRTREHISTINHIFFPTLYYFPILSCMKNPIVYTMSASLQGQKKPAHIDKLNRLHRIVVSNERDRRILASWGIHNYSIIHPGVDTSGVVPHPLPLQNTLTVLVASAPWEQAQFRSKGIDLLLQAAAQLPCLKLIRLWRGL